MPSVTMVESEMEACELKGSALEEPGFHLPAGVLRAPAYSRGLRPALARGPAPEDPQLNFSSAPGALASHLAEDRESCFFGGGGDRPGLTGSIVGPCIRSNFTNDRSCT